MMRDVDDLREAARAFVPPPGLERGAPREVTLSAGGWFLAAVAVAMFVAAVLVGVLWSRALQREDAAQEALADRGVTTSARVVRLWRGEEAQRPHVAYRFEVNDRAYSGEGRLPAVVWRPLRTGETLTVRYVPDNPAISMPAQSSRSQPPLWLPAVVALVLVTIGMFCLFGIQQQRQLLIEGRVTAAIVRSHKKRHSSHGGTHRSMTYDFALLNGAVASGRSRTSSKPPAVGSVICVVYDPDRPSRNLAYPFELVRARP